LLKDADEASKRTGINSHPVSSLKVLILANKSIFIKAFFDELDYLVINRNRLAAETDHVMDAARKLDAMKLSNGVEARKNVTRKQRLGDVFTSPM
jgi:hypothetical protein